MKPLRPKRTISSALARPITAPTASVIGIAQALLSSPSPWATPVGAINQAATPGASPNVDSSDRSILPTSSTSVWASTSNPTSDICWRTLSRLSECRKTGLTICPTMPMRMIAGTSAKSRSRAIRIRGAPRRVCAGMTSAIADPLHRRDQLGVAPAAVELTHDLFLEHHEHAVAAAQVVELVADDQHAGAAPRGAIDRLEQGLLGAHVDPRRRRDQHQDSRLARQRTAEDDLLLVASGEIAHRGVQAGGLDVELLDQRARPPLAPARVHQARRAEPVGHGQRD